MTITTLHLCSLLAADIERRHSYDTLALCDAIVASCEASLAARVAHIDALISHSLSEV